MKPQYLIAALITASIATATGMREVNKPIVARSQELEVVVDEAADRACIARCAAEYDATEAQLDAMPARPDDCECE